VTPPPVIDEPSHPRVRAARRCHTAAGRAKTGRFLAEGVQAAREALATPGAVVEVLATPEWLNGPTVLPITGVPVHPVSGRVLSAVAETDSPQGVVAVCRDVTVTVDVLLERRPRLVVVLAEVRDPGNAGTIIRTADAAGADGVVLTRASVDPLSGKCVRASVGSVFHLPIVTGQGIDVLPRLRDAGLTVLAADGTATTSIADPTLQARLAGATAWVVGNEAHGVPAPYADAADERVAVPLYGRAESLNVSIASALCLYASAQAQHPAGPARGGAAPARH
jgi:TrmH family RNA methyltransferase